MRLLVACEGTSHKRDTFRYRFPQTEAIWKQDMVYELTEQQRLQLNLPFKPLTEKKHR